MMSKYRLYSGALNGGIKQGDFLRDFKLDKIWIPYMDMAVGLNCDTKEFIYL